LNRHNLPVFLRVENCVFVAETLSDRQTCRQSRWLPASEV
jgi:hypothetical protein